MKENKIEKLILNLSNRWDCSPREAVDRLNSMDESEINKLIKSMAKKFNNGGFIDCLRNGGTIPTCKCGKKIDKGASGMTMDGDWDDYHTIINAPGDTLRFKQYYSGPVTMQTHPEGGITYTQSYDGGINHMYNKDYKPSWWDRFWYGMKPVDRETEQNWQQLIKNHKNDPAVKDKTQKKQMGGTIEDAPIVINDNPFTNLNSSAPTVQKIDKFGGNFNSAFAAARRSGLGEFEWNGKRYGTALAKNALQSKLIDGINAGYSDDYYVVSDRNGMQRIQKIRK